MTRLADLINKKNLLDEELDGSIKKFLLDVKELFPKDQQKMLIIGEFHKSISWGNVLITHNRDACWMVSLSNSKALQIHTTIPSDIKQLLIALRNTKATKSL